MTGARTTRSAVVSACAAAVFLAASVMAASPSCAEEINQRRFEYEFAVFVQSKLESGREIRAKLVEFVKENRGAVAEGFGKHPDLVPKMFEAVGLEKLNCISGRHYDEFEAQLDKDGFTLFYGVKQGLSHWVTMVALEEASRHRIFTPSPPINYRRRGDYPPFIALTIHEVIRPYLEQGPGEGPGLGFDDFGCD